MDQLPFINEPSKSELETASTNELANISLINSLRYVFALSNSQVLKLITNYKSVESLKNASPLELEMLAKCGRVDFSKLKSIDLKLSSDVKAISYFDDSYPKNFRDLPDAPMIVWYRGQIPSNNAISIVGTRNADERSSKIAHEIAAKSCDFGLSVISGLALGIDTEAHKGALSADGITVAILACDVSYPTPTSNTNLAKEILDKGGCLMSEVPPGSTTNPGQLIARNRLQAAWGKALVVVQSGVPSGTLHTVRNAIQLHRKLMVIAPPSRTHNSAYEGNLQLIEPIYFDSSILGGSKTFQKSLSTSKPCADFEISNLDSFVKAIEKIYD